MKKIIMSAAATVCVSGFIAAPAAAEEVSVEVDYSDLDIASSAGASALAERIEAAVDTVCARPGMRNLKGFLALEKCKDAARSGAAEQLSRAAAPRTLALLAAHG